MKATGLAAGAAILLVLVSTLLLILGAPSQPSSNCVPALSPGGGDTVLAGVVAPPPAVGPGQASSSPKVLGRRSMPMTDGTYTITSGFGIREGGENHLGVDMAAPEATTIYAAMDGTVVAAGPASGFGNWIVVDSLDENGRPVSTVYGHMWDSGVGASVGQQVSAGDPIGAVGSAGQSTGPHLHFEVVPGGRFTGGSQIDPMPWLAGSAAPAPVPGPSPSPSRGAPPCPPGFGTAGGQLDTATVPADLASWYQLAGSLCPQISASLLAAQGKQESGFRRGLTSGAGAQGLSQFLPSTATSINPDDGQPYVIDADGNGTASVWDDGDAIVGQGRYMCALARKVESWKAEGKVAGDTTTLVLAAYNAGEGAVLQYGGVPPYSETSDYVRLIVDAEPGFRSAGSSGRFTADPKAGLGPQILQAGGQWRGTPYVIGGGGPDGPSKGGFDCSGLTSAAVSAASNGQIILPRTSEQQWAVGSEVTPASAQAGDLVFSNWNTETDLPGHVGIATGGGHVLHAPDTGQAVREDPMPGDARVRRIGEQR
ncbi:peptidoglycan DD-metalloendopeptidase family protein [Nocardia brasiliensis]|uniref:peptidoglycan DD-metalloendopeptidase family protein n=1 Tax=Nocardia brasiliensis TaxID=37326 RepID=UPI003D8E4E41